MEAKEIETLITPVVDQEGGEIIDLQWRREGHQWVLRLFIDKPNGITLDDCAQFSDRIGAFLDEKNAIEQSYVLEISSPGLDRVIKKDKDFEKFAGKAVKVRVKIAGILKGLQDGKVAVQIGEAVKTFDKKNIDEIRLDDSADVDFGEN
jgi:ribosome maturation factor RimP